MASPTYLAIDVMGGDESPHLFVCATLSFLQKNPQVFVMLFGSQAVIDAAKQHSKIASVLSRIDFIAVEVFVAPDEKPASALRRKRESSMGLALQAVAKGDAQAALSAGNTGALMVMAKHFLGVLPGVDRPAMCKKMPLRDRQCYVLDLGASTTASALQLKQFALMGAALAEADCVSPVSVGLLNVGSESHKGTAVLREADEQLRQCSRFNYRGFVEGGALFDGGVNVVVCDGFTGNVALKACEGLASYLKSDLKQYFGASLWRRCVAGLMRMAASRWFRQLNPAGYNGALLVGLSGVVIKSHGAAGERAFDAALRLTLEQARHRPQLHLARWLGESPRLNND